MQDSGGGLA